AGYFTKRTAMSQRARLAYGGLVWLAALWLGDVATARAQSPRAPQWTHGLDLKCRKSTEPVFTDKTRTFGLEVFRDDNNGNGVYIAETGAIAAVPGFPDRKAPIPDSKAPEWMHGLDLKVRKAGENEFTPA